MYGIDHTYCIITNSNTFLIHFWVKIYIIFFHEGILLKIVKF